MKHNLKITLSLLAIFLLAQLVGIFVLYLYIDQPKSTTEGKTVFKELPVGERPPLKEKTSFIPIILTVLVGTALVFLLFKYHIYWLWKIWYLTAVVLSLTICWGVLVKPIYAFLLAAILGLWKIFKPNVFIHNFTEVFIYGGLTAIFVPVFNLWSVFILLILISIYDIYAVWKSKHMIFLAQSQAKAKVFAGLLIPYKKMVGKIKQRKKVQTAVLGGGDIGFPLIFTGVVLKIFGLWQSLVIPLFTGTALLLLLLKGKEKKFYPAMPFLTIGCLAGLAAIWLLMLIF